MPIRINLLAEAQAAEEMRRRDPVKRAVWIAGALVLVVAAWVVFLQVKIMKASGQLRYVGITTSEGRCHRDFEQIMRTQPLDFVQVSYNVLDREADARILPLAQERGMAVIINRPFRQGALIDRVARHPLPPWAGEIGCVSWAQLLLKFIIAHPAVTCVIPATANPDHARDNVGAGIGPMLGADARAKLLRALGA